MEKLTHKPFCDDRGTLLPIEFDSLPFLPVRIFTVTNVPINMVRGNHSHFKTIQYLLCLKGRIEVILHNGHNETKTVIEENQGILVPNLIWDSQKFLSDNATLIVLCSTQYDEKDYIFDFNEFKTIKLTEKK